MAYDSVNSRYMDHKPPKNPESKIPDKEYIPKNPAYRSVNSRVYDHTEPYQGQRSQVPPSPFHDANEHKRMSTKLGFGGVGAKFNDELYTHTRAQRAEQAEGGGSPREKVEHKMTVSKDIRNWRSPGRRMPHSFTFQSVQRQTDSRLGTPKSKVTATSSVREFIRDGTPLKHHSQYHQPKERHEDPDNMLPKWHSGGVSRNQFVNLEKDSTRSRPQYASMKERVGEVRESMRNKTVPRDGRPRCAQYAPAFQVAQMEQEAERQRSSELASQSQARTNASPDPDFPAQEEEEEQNQNGYGGYGEEPRHQQDSEEPQQKKKVEPLSKPIPLKWTYKGRHTF